MEYVSLNNFSQIIMLFNLRWINVALNNFCISLKSKIFMNLFYWVQKIYPRNYYYGTGMRKYMENIKHRFCPHVTIWWKGQKESNYLQFCALFITSFNIWSKRIVLNMSTLIAGMSSEV